MTTTYQRIVKQCSIIIVLLFIFIAPVCANNLQISNVTLEERNPSAGTVVVEFDLSWDNAWKTKINHDAVWVTLRLNDPEATIVNKKLVTLSASGVNPFGSSVGSNTDCEIFVPTDKMGAFIRPSSYGKKSSLSTTNMRLTIDYVSAGFSSVDTAKVSVHGLEMVYIPQGAFYAGDYDTSTGTLHQGSADSAPWYIEDEDALSVTNAVSDGYRYVSSGNVGENPSGSAFTLSADFPKGFGAFYAMKYEISEGQWVEFLNSLPSSAARAHHDVTDSNHKNSDLVKSRNTVSCSGSPLSCSTERKYRAMSYLTWMDVAAFLDWMALRPMSELEYEKMARGPLLSVAGEFAWGTTDITAAAALSSGDEDGTETVATTGANALYNNISLSGGDSASGAEYVSGPVRSGIFATAATNRQSAGAGYYGVMELSGNLKERVVTLGNSEGRSFIACHGDGVLSDVTSFEGYATCTDWPGIDLTPTRGVTGATGSGFKGGSWSDQASGNALRISDRYESALTSSAALNNAGGRGVRTYDGE